MVFSAVILWGGSGRATGEPIERALALFAAAEVATMPRIVLATIRPEIVAPDAEAFVVPGYPVIYVAGWSDTYRCALAGDRDGIVKLASIIAHERAHVERGPDERNAYAAEVSMLRRCKAPAAMIDGVCRAMRRVAPDTPMHASAGDRPGQPGTFR